MNEHEKINYFDFPAKNMEVAKDFFATVFGWSFVDYGPEYTAFSNGGIDGGFFQADVSVSTENGSALIVFYSKDLEHTQAKSRAPVAQLYDPPFLFQGVVASILPIPMAMNMRCGQMSMHDKSSNPDRGSPTGEFDLMQAGDGTRRSSDRRRAGHDRRTRALT